MREWLVIENSWKNSVFAPDSAKEPNGYIPRDAAEKLLGRDLGGMVWFTREEGEQMRLHSEWRTTLPPNRTWWQQLLGLPTREVAEDVSALTKAANVSIPGRRN